MEVQPRQIQNYLRADGTSPFEDWYYSLRDTRARVRIKSRLDRVEEGNLGDCRSLGEGVFELRIDYGPGYRVYFGQVELTIFLVLIGGDKSTQEQDISKAKEYWADYAKRENANK